MAERFIGREMELGELCASFDRASSGASEIVFLSGEPGIGKTRLAAELTTHAERHGAGIVWGRAWEGQGAPAFWPWTQAIRALIARPTAKRSKDDLGSVGEWLRELLPEVAKPSGEGSERRIGNSGEGARFRIFEAVAELLRETGTTAPVVLVLDDLHWADEPSLLLLQFVVRELTQARILVLAIFRPAEAEAAPHVARTLGTMVRDGHHLELTGLEPSEVAVYLEGLRGETVGSSFVSKIFEATGGNPLFLEQVVRSLPAGAGSLRDHPALPTASRLAIARRIDALPSESVRTTLRVASVVGREFDAAVLADVLGRPTNEALDDLAATESHGLTRSTRDIPGRYQFAHSLVREALYEGMPIGERVAYHRSLGEVLEARFNAAAMPPFSQLAHHFAMASQLGVTDKAIRYSAKAGDHDMALHAYESAAVHYGRGIDLLDRSGADAGRLSELLLAFGDALRRAGDRERSDEALQRAIDLARGHSLSHVHARAALVLAGSRFTRAGFVDEATLRSLETALDSIGSEDSGLRARLLARLAVELHFSGAFHDAARLSSLAVEIAERSGDRHSLAWTSHARIMATYGPDCRIDLVESGTQIGALADEVGDEDLHFWGMHWRIIGALERGDLATLDRDLEHARQEVEDRRQPYHAWYVTFFEATRYLLLGQFEDAERTSERALRIADRITEPDGPLIHALQWYATRWQAGCSSDTQAWLEVAIAGYPVTFGLRAMLALVHCENGRPREARFELEALAASDFTDFPRSAEWALAVPTLTTVVSVLGDAARAALLYDLLAPFASKQLIWGHGVVYFGSYSHYLGMLAACMGRTAEAEEHFARALREHHRMRARPFTARTEYEYARLLLANGDETRGRERLDSARAIARALGMSKLEENIAAALAALEPMASARNLEENMFRRDGEFWNVAYEGVTCRLQESKGLAYVAILLSRPANPISALELAAVAERADPEQAAGARRTGDRQAGETVTRSSARGIETLDAEAIAAYRLRLRELDEELEEARGLNDLGRTEKLEGEKSFLSRELGAAVGLGGRARTTGSALERARLNVTRAIRSAIKRIEAQHRPLGAHLAKAIETGNSCVYDPRTPTSWST